MPVLELQPIFGRLQLTQHERLPLDRDALEQGWADGLHAVLNLNDAQALVRPSGLVMLPKA